MNELLTNEWTKVNELWMVIDEWMNEWLMVLSND